jgi:hypothetical protein
MRKIMLCFVVAACAAVGARGGAPVKLWEREIGVAGSFRPFGGAVVADLDGNGKDDVVVAAADGKCHVWRANGTVFPGFPTQVHRSGYYFTSSPAVGDIDGDGDLEVVVGGRGTYPRDGGALYAWHHSGKAVSGFPKDEIYVSGSVALEDLDGDGACEMIAAENNYPAGRVHVYDGAGKGFPGWPKNLASGPDGEFAVGDIDGDGEPEILLPSKTQAGRYALFAWNADGTAVNGFPYLFHDPKTYMGGAAPTLADWNNDGKLEIGFGTGPISTPTDPRQSYFYLLDGKGKVLPGWPKKVGRMRTAASAADVDGDGRLEIVAHEYHPGGYLYVWNYNGSAVTGFPVSSMEDMANAAVADVDGDGRFEIIGNRGWGEIVGFNHDGSPLAGFPVLTRGDASGNSVVIWDIDRDGALEMVTVSSNWGAGYVEAYRLGGDADSPVWPMHNHDRRHTCCYDTDLGIGIKLTYFRARAEGEAVLLRWATGGEWNHAGFNLYRAPAGGDDPKTKLNSSLVTGKSPYTFLDGDVDPGEEYDYWLEAVELSGGKETYGPVRCSTGGAAKASFALAQNRPNPARATTTVAFSVSAPCEATLAIYDLAGRRVASRVAAAAAGNNELELDVSAFAPGVYTYRLEAGGEAAAKRMVVVR